MSVIRAGSLYPCFLAYRENNDRTEIWYNVSSAITLFFLRKRKKKEQDFLHLLWNWSLVWVTEQCPAVDLTTMATTQNAAWMADEYFSLTHTRLSLSTAFKAHSGSRSIAPAIRNCARDVQFVNAETRGMH